MMNNWTGGLRLIVKPAQQQSRASSLPLTIGADFAAAAQHKQTDFQRP
jgi:hypothetical protein